MPGTSYITGLISGLDLDSILTQLLEVSRAPIERLEAKQEELDAKLAAWQSANTSLLALKTEAADLARLSTFNAKTAVSSNESILSATATASAPAGVYAVTVNAVATYHQVASQGFADYDATSLGSGTVSLQIGDQPAAVLEVDDLTLAGLRDVINNADLGVHAAILNDGSDTAPWRLVLTSEESGTAGAITLSADLSGGTAPAFTDMRAAQDASVTLGSGEGAISITKSSNTIDDVIPGVTLSLHSADAGQTLTVSIEHDVASIRAAIDEFVEQYNSVMDFINEQFSWDADAETSGTLFGEFTLQQIQSDLRSRVSNVLSGISGEWALLSQIGITTDAEDHLVIDDTTLDAALRSDPEDVAKLFTRFGQPTDSHVGFVYATAETQASGAAGYAVEITQVATKSQVTAGVRQLVALAADETLTVNGVEIALTAGMLQDDVVAAVNAHTAETGVVASATGADGTGTGDYLTFSNVGYGAGDMTIVSDTANGGGAPFNTSGVGNVAVSASDPGGESGAGQGALGLNVEGTIGGEACEGHGQVLTCTAGDPDGLSLTITATSTGSYGSVVYSTGAAGGVDNLLDFLTTSEYSPIKTAQKTIQDRIDYITDEIADLEERVAAEQERIRARFEYMEEALGALQTQSTFLEQQLSQIENNWKGA